MAMPGPSPFEARLRLAPQGDGPDDRILAYLIACGLIGEPVPPVMISGGPAKKNS
jgi:hypothetical protein